SLIILPPPRPTLFPYTTLFRSLADSMSHQFTDYAVAKLFYMRLDGVTDISHPVAGLCLGNSQVEGVQGPMQQQQRLLRRSLRGIRVGRIAMIPVQIDTTINGDDVAFPQRVLPRKPMKDRKSTRLNSSHVKTSYAVFCLKNNNTSTDG